VKRPILMTASIVIIASLSFIGGIQVERAKLDRVNLDPETISIRFAENAEGLPLAQELFNEARANGECVVVERMKEGLPLWLRSCTSAEIKEGYR